MSRLRLVMIARLQEIDSAAADEIDDSVFLRQTSRPCAGGKIFKRLGLADTLERIIENCFDKIKGP